MTTYFRYARGSQEDDGIDVMVMNHPPDVAHVV